MDGANLYIITASIALAVGSILLNFTGRQKYKDNASFFESANNELRQQNISYKNDNTDLSTKLAAAQATVASQAETIKQLKPFSEVVTTMSNNHTAVMTTLSEVTKLITGKVDGHQ